MTKGGNQASKFRVVALSLAIDATPPTEFRIFSAGENTSTKGTYLFDEIAARELMADYAAHGVDVMLDLEHLSAEDPQESRNYDPDARGWCKLQLRNGELWAVDVTWTPDGAQRLTDRRQRYVSPLFLVDSETRRIKSLLNVAITAMPATDHIAPLVAASRRQRLTFYEGDSPMSPEQFAALAEALGLGADANVEDVLATVAAMVKKIQDAANGVSADDAAGAGDMAPPAAAANAAPMIAASRIGTAMKALTRLSGRKEIGAVLVEVEAWRTSHLELEKQTAALASERKTLEHGERHRLVADLVKLGTETPATAWADDDAKTPAEPWASMPIDKLRDRVAKLTQAKGGKKPAGTDLRVVRGGNNEGAGDESKPGKSFNVNGTTVELSASELEACEDMKAKPEDYAKNKLIRSKAR